MLSPLMQGHIPPRRALWECQALSGMSPSVHSCAGSALTELPQLRTNGVVFTIFTYLPIFTLIALWKKLKVQIKGPRLKEALPLPSALLGFNFPLSSPILLTH